MVNIGVVISVYGRYNYIGEAIESALKQTLKPKEIVVVADDPDKVPFRDKVYVVEAKDRKYGTTIMKGVDATASDAIALLDDDDKFHPDKLRVVSRILERHPEVTAIHNAQRYIDAHGNELSDNDSRILKLGIVRQPRFTLLLAKHNALQWFDRYVYLGFNNSSIVVRRDVFESHKPIIRDIELSLDSALSILSINDGYYLHVPTKLTYYRIGSGDTTMNTWGNPVRVKHRLCMIARFAHDAYMLYNYIRDSACRRIIEIGLAYYLTVYWYFSPFIDCGVRIPLSTADILNHTLKRLRLIYSLSDLINAMLVPAALLGLGMWGRRWLADLSLRMRYGIGLASITNSRLAGSPSS